MSRPYRLIQPVTRIEGHAKISIQLDDAGEVESAQFHVTEFRGFEKLCEGRPFRGDARTHVARLRHLPGEPHPGEFEGRRHAAGRRDSAGRGEAAPPGQLRPDPAVARAELFSSFRRPICCSAWMRPPEKRNIFGLLERDPDFLRRGIRLRQFGQRVIELVGGKTSASRRGAARAAFTRASPRRSAMKFCRGFRRRSVR